MARGSAGQRPARGLCKKVSSVGFRHQLSIETMETQLTREGLRWQVANSSGPRCRAALGGSDVAAMRADLGSSWPVNLLVGSPWLPVRRAEPRGSAAPVDSSETWVPALEISAAVSARPVDLQRLYVCQRVYTTQRLFSDRLADCRCGGTTPRQ